MCVSGGATFWPEPTTPFPKSALAKHMVDGKTELVPFWWVEAAKDKAMANMALSKKTFTWTASTGWPSAEITIMTNVVDLEPNTPLVVYKDAAAKREPVAPAKREPVAAAKRPRTAG